jgi:hypothetical protein
LIGVFGQASIPVSVSRASRVRIRQWPVRVGSRRGSGGTHGSATRLRLPAVRPWPAACVLRPQDHRERAGRKGGFKELRDFRLGRRVVSRQEQHSTAARVTRVGAEQRSNRVCGLDDSRARNELFDDLTRCGAGQRPTGVRVDDDRSLQLGVVRLTIALATTRSGIAQSSVAAGFGSCRNTIAPGSMSRPVRVIVSDSVRVTAAQRAPTATRVNLVGTSSVGQE